MPVRTPRPAGPLINYELRLPVLVMVLLACTFVFTRVLPCDPILQERLTRPFRANTEAIQQKELDRMREQDPPLGTVLPIPSTRSQSSRPLRMASTREHQQHYKYTLVLMLGPCSVCMRSTLELAEDLAAKQPMLNAVAVSPSSSRELQNFRATNHLHLDIVSDDNKQLAHRYNAAWIPRAYLLSASGALLWCQSGPNFVPQQAEAVIAGRHGG
jgi:hypothetical protein